MRRPNVRPNVPNVSDVARRNTSEHGTGTLGIAAGADFVYEILALLFKFRL